MMVIYMNVSIESIQWYILTCIYVAYIETLLSAPRSTGIPPYHGKYIKPLTDRENPN